MAWSIDSILIIFWFLWASYDNHKIRKIFTRILATAEIRFFYTSVCGISALRTFAFAPGNSRNSQRLLLNL